MVKCPNKNHPEWKELERLLPDQAYVVWDAFPYGIDKAPNGADSKLFKDLLEHYNGDRDSAIRAKAKTVTDAFKTWFGEGVVDSNAEPILNGSIFTNSAVSNITVDSENMFDTTSNIYYKLMNDVQEAKSDMYKKYAASPQVNEALKVKFTQFNNTSDAIKYSLDNNLVPEKLIDVAKLLSVHSTKLIFSSEGNPGELGGYTRFDTAVTLYDEAFATSPELVVETLLHEVMHYYVDGLYEHDPEYAAAMDLMYKKYLKLCTEKEISSHYGLVQGTSIEFINEVMTNSEFREFLKKKDISLWQRLLRAIARFLKRDTAFEINTDDMVDAFTALFENINKLNKTFGKKYTDEYLEESSSSEAIESLNAKFSKDSSAFVNGMRKDSEKLRIRIKSGLESRIKALKQYGKITSNQVMRLEQEVIKLEAMYDSNEDKLALLEFIKHASIESYRPVTIVNKAHDELRSKGEFSLRNDQLIQLQKDFIGFYEPIIEDINLKLRIVSYFDDMPETEQAFINNEMSAITNNFAVIKSKYSNLLAKRFAELLLKYGNTYDSNSIQTYVDDNVNSTNTDLGFFVTYIGGMKNAKDEALKLISRRIVDAQNGIERATVKKASELLPIFKRVSDWQQFYELDKDGKKTGYLVRDKNYGQYYRDRDVYFDSLGEAPTADKVALKEWYTKRNKWLSDHTERRYKSEYYDLFNDMGFAAKEARDGIQMEISSILADYTDRKGTVHLENIPDKDWDKLQGLYTQKRMLANHYYADGSRKSGIDEEIADDLSNINKVLSEQLTYKSNQAKFDKVAEEKKATLTPEQYDKWYDRSTRIGYSEAFQEDLKKLERKYYNEDYEMLAEERRELTSMYRNIHDFAINTTNMPKSVKDRIKALDKQMNDIASQFPKVKSDFSKIAYIDKSIYYKNEKEAALARDKSVPGFYKQWRDENHYTDARGVLIPYSYFNIMLPTRKDDVIIMPSREYSEADPTSNYWNNNFDESDSENVQPKRSLYDNKAAYDVVASNEDTKAMYDAIIDTMSESNDKITFMQHKNNYKLPQISGNVWAHIQSKDSVMKGIGGYLKDSVLIKQDDLDYNYDSASKNTAPDGRRLSTIPVHYVKMLDNPSAITNDLGGSIIKYFEMAENFTQKQAMLPELELLQEQIDNRVYTPETTHEKLDQLRRFNRGKGETNVSKRLNKYYDINLYGQSYTPLVIGKFNATKLLVHLKSYFTLVNLGLSPFVASANFMGGIHQHNVEALAGSFYTSKAAAIAFKEFVYYLGNVIWNWGDYTHSNKMLSAMNFNQISRETSNMYDKLNWNRAARFVNKHGMYGMITAGDFVVKSQIMMSVYLSTKYVPEEGFMTRDDYFNKYGKDQTKEVYDSLGTPTLWDIYENNGTTLKIKEKYANLSKYVTPEFTNKVINTVKYLTQRADGMVDSTEKNTAQTNALLGFIFMHKGFLFSAIDDRILKPKGYNYMTGRMDEAMYRTAVNRLMELFKYTSDLRKYRALDEEDRGDKPKLSKLESYQKYNLKRVGVEISLVIAYNLISMMLNNWNDDEDSWFSNAITYTHDRPTYEAGNLFNPWDVFNSFKTLSPANATLENFKTVVSAIWFPGWQDLFNKSTKYGPYKGMNKFKKAAIKATPLKNIIEATDPKQKHKYLKGQLQ